MIEVHQKGDFGNLEKYLNKSLGRNYQQILEHYGELGVNALSTYSPRDTGRLASSWYYKIEETKNSISVTWCNSDIEHEINVALIVQYGHATKSGSYVEGEDYINPALKPIFEDLAEKAWKEVTES